MDIATVLKQNEGARVCMRVVISDKKLLPKANKEEYLSLDIQDSTGKLNFPVWTDVKALYDVFEVGMIIDIVDATLGFWNDTPQLKNPRFHILTEQELKKVDIRQFVPSYDIPRELITYMEQTINKLEEPYRTIAIFATGALGHDEIRWKAFTECVSAEKHHGNKRGGLFLHTYGVLKAVDNVIKDYVTNPYFYDASSIINVSRLRLKAILHDLKKVDEYEYKTIIRRKPDKKVGHIYNGIIYLNEINKEAGNILSEEDLDDIANSFLTHHGQWGPKTPETTEEWILHLADMIDSRIVGCLEK